MDAEYGCNSARFDGNPVPAAVDLGARVLKEPAVDFTVQELQFFLPRGYLLTITLETPILLLGLSACHGARRRLLSGLWLTACTLSDGNPCVSTGRPRLV